MILDAYESPSHRLSYAVSFVSRFEVPLVPPAYRGGQSTDSGTGPIRGPPCMQADEEEKVEVIHCILRLDHCLLEF
jgi:hypothetical protein